jgi:hypothetical protein
MTDFRAAIVPLLRLRQRSELVRQTLYASKMLGDRPVVGQLSFVHCLYQGGEQHLRRSVLQWITKQGPFLDDDRQQIEDDYFAFEGHDVTDQGLGEAARRRHFNLEAGCFSFVGGPVDCERNPLTVQHGPR